MEGVAAAAVSVDIVELIRDNSKLMYMYSKEYYGDTLY